MSNDFDLDDATPAPRKPARAMLLKALTDAARRADTNGDGQVSAESFREKVAAMHEGHEGPAPQPARPAPKPAAPAPQPPLRLTRDGILLAIALGGILDRPRCRDRR